MKKIQILCLVSLVVATSACTKWWNKADEEKNPFQGMTAKELYTESQTLLKKKQYASSAKRLEAIETMYPFSDYSAHSQMDLIFAYYENEEYPAAAATAERYIHLYPRDPHVDYAYYLKGLADFQQMRGIFAKYLPMDEAWRDPGTQSQAYSDFAILVQKFPNSPYTPDAKQRMIYLRNNLALHELYVSQYYVKRKMYVAAVERANFLVKNYPQAPSVQPALLLLRDANNALGLHQAAEEAMTVYQANYG